MSLVSRTAVLIVIVLVVAACASAGSTASPPPSPAPSESPVTTATSSTPSPPPETPAPSATAGSTPAVSPSAAAITSVAWRTIDVAGAPDPREDQTWTVDPASRIAYLFGGRDRGTIHDDLWAYDLATDQWDEIEPANDGPEGRFGHEAVWIDGLGLVVWAGQSGPTTFFDDLWAYDPAANRWTKLPNGGERPLARYGSCAALGPDGRLWISHGFTEDGTRFADTRAYDFGTGTWSDQTPAGTVPVNRCLHGCWFSEAGDLVLYAGQTTGVQALGDLWSLSGAGTGTASWARADGPLPDDRNLYAFAPYGDRMIVFGGRGLGAAYHRDVFAVTDTGPIEPLEPNGARPPGRSGATFVTDPAGGRLLLFGGRNAIRAFDDLWELALR